MDERNTDRDRAGIDETREQDNSGGLDLEANLEEVVRGLIPEEVIAQAAEEGRPIEVNLSDVNVQVNEGDGTFTPNETGDVIADPATEPVSTAALEDHIDNPTAQDTDLEGGLGGNRFPFRPMPSGDGVLEEDPSYVPSYRPRRPLSEDAEAGDPAATDETIGTPEEDIDTWDGKQNYDDTCAIRCQEFILEQFTGQEVSEDALVQQAQDNGWYQPGQGTMPEDMGNLLEANGVATTGYIQGATPHDLANELAQGHKVIIGVDSGELWGEENPIMEDLASIAPTDGADHAVIISGIDTTDPDNPQVIISDPGTGEAAAHYPLDQFMASWQDSNFFMTATEDPAPPTAPEMVNFDYEEGHIPEVAGMPYDEFVALNDNLERFNELLEQILETIGVDVPDDQGPDTVDGDIVDQTSVEQDVFVDQTVPNQDGVAQPVDPAEAAPAAEDGQPIEVNISDMNIQVNEGDGTFAPEETGDVITPGGGGPADPAVPVDFYVDPAGPVAPGIDVDQTVMDQNLFDPAAPGPTLPVDLFDPAAPGPTLPIELLDPAAPGPTLDPALLDPEMPGPTLDPILLDPTAPGPTLNPALLDPSAPGPTLDPALVDPASPGPTLPPELLDPTAPGPTLDPALLDPEMPGPTLEPAMLDPMSPGPVLDPALLDPTSPGPTLDPDLLDPEAPGPTLDPADQNIGLPGTQYIPLPSDMNPAVPGTQVFNPTNPDAIDYDEDLFDIDP